MSETSAALAHPASCPTDAYFASKLRHPQQPNRGPILRTLHDRLVTYERPCVDVWIGSCLEQDQRRARPCSIFALSVHRLPASSEFQISLESWTHLDASCHGPRLIFRLFQPILAYGLRFRTLAFFENICVGIQKHPNKCSGVKEKRLAPDFVISFDKCVSDRFFVVFSSMFLFFV